MDNANIEPQEKGPCSKDVVDTEALEVLGALLSDASDGLGDSRMEGLVLPGYGSKRFVEFNRLGPSSRCGAFGEKN